MFSPFLCLAICIQACVRADSSESWKPTNNTSKLIEGGCLEADGLKPMDKLEDLEEFDVVEVDQPRKPVLHGTILRITSQDKLCNLRMSTNKYPVK